MPFMRVHPTNWSYIQNIKLENENLHTPGSIDMLIGAELYKDVVLSGRIGGPTGQPTAFETIFGLVLLYTWEAIRETELEVFVFFPIQTVSRF